MDKPKPKQNKRIMNNNHYERGMYHNNNNQKAGNSVTRINNDNQIKHYNHLKQQNYKKPNNNDQTISPNKKNIQTKQQLQNKRQSNVNRNQTTTKKTETKINHVHHPVKLAASVNHPLYNHGDNSIQPKTSTKSKNVIINLESSNCVQKQKSLNKKHDYKTVLNHMKQHLNRNQQSILAIYDRFKRLIPNRQSNQIHDEQPSNNRIDKQLSTTVWTNFKRIFTFSRKTNKTKEKINEKNYRNSISQRLRSYSSILWQRILTFRLRMYICNLFDSTMINQENNHRQSTNPCQTSLLTTIFQTIRRRTINLFRQYWPLLDNKMKIKKTNNNNNQQSNSVQPMKTKSIIKRPTIESNRIQPTTSPTLIDSKQAKKLSPPSSILMINNDENFNQAPLDTNQMLIKSDSYAILCDINCHNWIIALINWSIIYPRFILPTNQYFQFASVHDVSNLGNYFDNDNQFCLRLCCCCGGLCSYHHHQQQQYRKQQNRQQKQQQQQQQSSSTKNYHHQQQLSMTTIQINQRQNFQSINNDNNNNDANQQPLSVINSPINENPEIMMITTKTPSIKSLNLDSDSKQQRRTLNDELLNKNHKCANNDDCQTEITPDFSDVAYYPSILNTNQTDHNENINRKSEMINNQMDDQKIYSQNKQLPNKQIPFNKDDNDHRSTSSQSILSANSICCHVQHWKFYLIITLFIFISLRYLIHLVIIIFGNDNQEKNMIHFDYGYCPLIVAMLESLTTMLTIMIVYCRRTPIEELIIIKSSFFRPLCPWQRTYFIRMISILYLILSMIFFILTFCSWFPQITGIDSEWHHFRRSDSNIFTKYIWQQQQPITATTTTMSISMSRPPSTLDNNNQHSTTIHNQRSKRNSSEFQTISTINIDNITTFLDDNIDNTDDDDDDSVDYNSNVMIENNLTNTSSLINKTTTQRLPRYSSLPVNMFTTTPITTPSSIDHSTKSISSSNQKNKWWQIIEIWHLFFYFDFISNILCKYSLLLIKTLHLSVTILIILKCWQLYNEIRRLKYYFKNNNIDHFQRRQTNDTTTTTSSSLDIIKSNESIIIIDNHNSRFGQRSRRRRHHHHQRQSEMERLTILTRILCKNIRYYHNVFGHLLLIWLLLTIFTLIAIWEFYKCSDQQNRLQKSIINNESNQQFHDWLIPYSMLIYHSIDLAIMFIFYLIIRILRYQCLWLIN